MQKVENFRHQVNQWPIRHNACKLRQKVYILSSLILFMSLSIDVLSVSLTDSSNTYQKISKTIPSYHQNDHHRDATVEWSTHKREVSASNASHYTVLSSSTVQNSDRNLSYKYVEYRPCTLRILTDRSLSSDNHETNILERALICSHLNEREHLQPLRALRNTEDIPSVQQLEISSSSSSLLAETLNLICNQFDCSKLMKLNLTGVKLDNCSLLNSWVRMWPELEVLDLSNTSLHEVECILETGSNTSRLVMSKLSTLLLDDNEIIHLNFDSFLDQMPSLSHLSIVNNSVFYISCDESLRPRLEKQFELISLANNSINCDKSLLWLMRQFIASNTRLRFPEYDQIKCGAPERFAEMTWTQRVSVLETRICDDCECKSMKKTAIAVDCHNRSLTVLPDILPFNTKILNLTSNRINSLSVPQNSKNWENVTYVYLEDNLISSFYPLEGSSKFMRNLAALDIRRNKFQEFPSYIFEQFTNLDQVHLSNNPWLCDCEPTFAFQEWLQRQFQKVGDKEEIKCGISGSDENGVSSYDLDQRLSSRVIYRLDKSELCPQENLEDPQDWLSLLNLFLSITIILILLKVTLDYLYQHRTKRLPHFFKLNY